MALRFARSRPLQASKLVAIVSALLFALGGLFGLVPNQELAGLLLVVALGMGLVLVIVAETLHAGYRLLRTGGSVTGQLGDQPIPVLARAIETVAALVAVGSVAFLVVALPDGPMAGPGAIGLLFVLVGLSLLALGGSLLRALVEYHAHRRDGAA